MQSPVQKAQKHAVHAGSIQGKRKNESSFFVFRPRYGYFLPVFPGICEKSSPVRFAFVSVSLHIVEDPHDGEKGFLNELKKRILSRHHAVVIVAEGAGQELLKTSGELDASGNIKLGDIGLLLKDKITEYFKKEKIHINLKYIDPSYQIRSAPASPSDSIYCERLGNNAVHAAMAGKTKIVIGLVHGKYVHLPIRLVTAKRNKVNPEGSMWRDAMDATGQPILMVENEAAAIEKYRERQKSHR